MSRRQTGRLCVLSAPSGSGKSTVKDRLLSRRLNLVYSVSFTTRLPRPGEIDGYDYHFVTKERFSDMIRAGEFLEWAEVFGNFYGTSRLEVSGHLQAGQNVLADLDVKGGASVRACMPEAVLVFMVPPTAVELRRRLSDRRTESAADLDRRLAKARVEIERSRIYDFLLINDQLEEAVDGLEEIIFQGRGRPMAEAAAFWRKFFGEERPG